MFLPTHVVAGLIVGKATGNYVAGLAGALLIDLDHLIPYMRHGVLWNMKTFVRTITNDPYGGQRNVLHNVVVAGVVSALCILFSRFVGISFASGYASHLFLDALDGSDYYPLYPLKKLNLRGPIQYFSKVEFVVTIGLLVLLFLL